MYYINDLSNFIKLLLLILAGLFISLCIVSIIQAIIENTYKHILKMHNMKALNKNIKALVKEYGFKDTPIMQKKEDSE